MSLGAKLIELRQRSGKSLQEVADILGVSKTHIWSLEKGQSDNPSLELLTKLAELYKVPIDYLAGTAPEGVETAVDAQAMRFFRDFKQLGDAEQRILQDTLEAFLKRNPPGNGSS